jgi:hypothetical protein
MYINTNRSTHQHQRSNTLTSEPNQMNTPSVKSELRRVYGVYVPADLAAAKTVWSEKVYHINTSHTSRSGEWLCWCVDVDVSTGRSVPTVLLCQFVDALCWCAVMFSAPKARYRLCGVNLVWRSEKAVPAKNYALSELLIFLSRSEYKSKECLMHTICFIFRKRYMFTWSRAQLQSLKVDNKISERKIVVFHKLAGHICSTHWSFCISTKCTNMCNLPLGF